jgi:hypothetical protein
MAQHIQALTLHTAALGREIAVLRAERTRCSEAVVIPIASVARIRSSKDQDRSQALEEVTKDEP